MTETITISVSGHPQGKGRARFVRSTGHSYTPEKTRSYEGMIRYAAQEVMAGRELLTGPLAVQIIATFAVPPSWSKRKRREAIFNLTYPTKRPDLDNIAKAFIDACNAVVYADDAQIVRSELRKEYGEAPGVVMSVARMAA